MNVTLPDGTVVQGVPDDITKAQLATKLKANGMNVPDSWMAAPAQPQLKVASPSLIQADQPIQSQTPIGYGIGLANGWLGNELAKGARAIGISDLNSLRDIQNLPGAIETVLGSRVAPSAARAVAPEAEAPIAGSEMTTSPQSISSASATPAVSGASPSLQAAVRTAAQRGGGAVNQEALGRHLEADSLPVKIQLTQGQATQDPTLISQERNLRGKYPALADAFNKQNGQLVQNVQEIRDQVGPEVFSANPVDHGETLISAYKAKDAAAQADIGAKYKALADANGGDLPMDGRTFARTAQQALKKDMKAPFLPGSVQKIIDGFGDGEPMTFENFENMRTILASEARKADRAGDGNAARAVSVVRDALENMPVSSEAQGVKSLADIARTAARTRFQALDADPAYNAAVNDTVPADRFVHRFITGPSATKEGVATMQTNLADHPTAPQTMAVAALDHLKQQAGIREDWTGNFRSAAFNKALQALGPKLPSLLDPKTAETLQALGRVSRHVMDQPMGSSVNNSNTAVSALANYGKGSAEGFVNYLAHGLPVGTAIRKGAEHLSGGKFVKNATAPGAGLLHLPEKSGLLQ